MKYLFVATLFASLTAPAYADLASTQPSEKPAKTMKIVNKGHGMSKVYWVDADKADQPRAASFAKHAPYVKY